MTRVLLLVVVGMANAAMVVLSLSPALVSYAAVSPRSVSCPACSDPETQTALARASELGRAQVVGVIRSTAVPLVGSAALSAVAALGLFFVPRRPKAVASTAEHRL